MQVQGVLTESLEDDVCADVGQVEVVRVELPFCGRRVELVIAYAAMAHDKGIDTKVDGRLAGGVTRSERVEHELEVVGSVSVFTIECDVCAEYLCGGDGDASLCQGQDVHLDGEARGLEHLTLLLVVDEYVVDDDAVEEFYANMPYTNLRAKFFGKYRGHLGTDKTLHLG